MTVLITGASGQDGHYLSELCREQGHRVVGVGRTGPDRRINVQDFDEVESLIRECKPDYVFHFAADSSLSHDVLLSNHAAISTGAINILESCRRHRPHARVFLPGSAAQFENNGLPIDEDTPFHAASAYAAARIHTVYLARYFRALGLRCYVGFLFHHDSPLRSARHLNQKIARCAAGIAEGGGEKLRLGSLSVEKEFTFAGDMVRGMWTLVNQDEVWEAVIGSGRAYSIGAWVEACFQAVGTDWKPWVEEIADYKPDFQRLVSNPSRINRLGWRPEVTLGELAVAMVNSQRLKT